MMAAANQEHDAQRPAPLGVQLRGGVISAAGVYADGRTCRNCGRELGDKVERSLRREDLTTFDSVAQDAAAAEKAAPPRRDPGLKKQRSMAVRKPLWWWLRPRFTGEVRAIADGGAEPVRRLTARARVMQGLHRSIGFCHSRRPKLVNRVEFSRISIA